MAKSGALDLGHKRDESWGETEVLNQACYVLPRPLPYEDPSSLADNEMPDGYPAATILLNEHRRFEKR